MVQETLPYVPPALAPVIVIAELPLQEFRVPPAFAVGGVDQLTVLVLVTVPEQGATPTTVSVAIKEPLGFEPLGVNVQAAGFDPPLVHVPRPLPPVQVGLPVDPPPVAPVIGIAVPEPEQTFSVPPALAAGEEDHSTNLSLVIVPQGETPTTVSLNIPLPAPVKLLIKQPVSEVLLLRTTEPAFPV